MSRKRSLLTFFVASLHRKAGAKYAEVKAMTSLDEVVQVTGDDIKVGGSNPSCDFVSLHSTRRGLWL